MMDIDDDDDDDDDNIRQTPIEANESQVSGPSTFSLAPSQSISNTGTNELSRRLSAPAASTAGRKRQRTVSRAGTNPPEQNPWSKSDQLKFERRLIRLVASANLPFSFTENPEWVDLCNEYFPGAKNPSRKVLSSRILWSALDDIHAIAKVQAKNMPVTVQADGWTGLNNHHLVAFMMTGKDKVRSLRTRTHSSLTHVSPSSSSPSN
jgi:hypothetical protein